MKGIKGGKVDSVTFLLKVDMHCRCKGCIKKIRKAMESITNFHGVERVEPKMESGVVKVKGKVNPEKLRDWLHENINKRVDLVYPNNNQEPKIAYSAPSSAPPIYYQICSTTLCYYQMDIHKKKKMETQTKNHTIISATKLKIVNLEMAMKDHRKIIARRNELKVNCYKLRD